MSITETKEAIPFPKNLKNELTKKIEALSSDYSAVELEAILSSAYLKTLGLDPRIPFTRIPSSYSIDEICAGIICTLKTSGINTPYFNPGLSGPINQLISSFPTVDKESLSHEFLTRIAKLVEEDRSSISYFIDGSRMNPLLIELNFNCIKSDPRSLKYVIEHHLFIHRVYSQSLRYYKDLLGQISGGLIHSRINREIKYRTQKSKPTLTEGDVLYLYREYAYHLRGLHYTTDIAPGFLDKNSRYLS